MPSITIYTKGWCPYCSAAKKLLDDKGAAFTEIDIEKKPEARAELKITDGMIRLSVGLEAPVDLIADLDRGLAAMREG